MKYLFNPNKEYTAAHLWDDGDTYCKMFSTGGMSKRKTQVFDDPQERRVCVMCRNVWREIHEYTGEKYGE
jgi:hypothetical protein